MHDPQTESLIARHFADARIVSTERLTGGVSADAFQLVLELPGGEHRKIVVRKHGATHCGHGVELEFALLDALRAAGRAIPAPLAFGIGDGKDALPYVVLDYVEGSTAIPPDQAEARIAAMADELADIHATPLAGLPALPLRIDPVPELLDFLSDDAEWDGLRSRIAALENIAFAAKPVLLHGDYWPQNVIWRESAIAAVIDWEDAALGDPLSDVACACLELRYLYGERGAELFKTAYGEQAEIDPFCFALWQAYVAAAGHRSMGNWGLEPAREAAMRQTAQQSIREASRILCPGHAIP